MIARSSISILLVLQIYIWLLIAAAVLSWLVAFNVVNTRNEIVAGCIGDFLYRLPSRPCGRSAHCFPIWAESTFRRHHPHDPA